MTVGAAIALVLVGAAPIVVLATKKFKGDDGKRTDYFTVGGILLGAALVFAAAAQIYVVAYTATEMDLTAGTKVAVWATSLLVVAPLPSTPAAPSGTCWRTESKSTPRRQRWRFGPRR